MMYWPVLHISLKNSIKSLFSLYLVGVIGMLLPWTFPLFQAMIPYILVLSFFMLAQFHQTRLNSQTVLFFLFVYLAGFAIEVFGVSTGLIFGNYEYGRNLGFKFLDTPLLIGLNWLFLIYTTAALTDKRKLPTSLKVLLPSLAMLIYDLVAEQVAPKLGMWNFERELAPAQNYLAWFGLAILFHSMLQLMRIRISNPLSVVLLILQFLFFFILMLFLPN